MDVLCFKTRICSIRLMTHSVLNKGLYVCFNRWLCDGLQCPSVAMGCASAYGVKEEQDP